MYLSVNSEWSHTCLILKLSTQVQIAMIQTLKANTAQYFLKSFFHLYDVWSTSIYTLRSSVHYGYWSVQERTPLNEWKGNANVGLTLAICRWQTPFIVKMREAHQTFWHTWKGQRENCVYLAQWVIIHLKKPSSKFQNMIVVSMMIWDVKRMYGIMSFFTNQTITYK